MRVFLFFCFISLLLPVYPQMKYKGFGAFISLTESAHYYNNKDTDKKTTDSAAFLHPEYFKPQTHVSKERISWGAGAFLELGNDGLRWQTELEYMNKGAKEMNVDNFITGDRSGSYQTTKLTYIQWNNHLKFYYPLGYAHCYWMPGVRLEYLYKKSAPVYGDVIGSLPAIWFSGNLAVGYEFPLFKKFSAFAEFHWNPDVLSHTYGGNTKVRNRSFELRVGMMMRPRKRAIDDCNAPVYKGPGY